MLGDSTTILPQILETQANGGGRYAQLIRRSCLVATGCHVTHDDIDERLNRNTFAILHGYHSGLLKYLAIPYTTLSYHEQFIVSQSVRGGLIPPLTRLLGCRRFVSWNVANSVERVHNLPCRSLIPYQTDTNPPNRLEEANFATVLNHHEIPANRRASALDTLVIEHTQNVKASHCTVAHNVVPCVWYLQSLTPPYRTTNSLL